MDNQRKLRTLPELQLLPELRVPFINTLSAIYSHYLSTVIAQSGHIVAQAAHPVHFSGSVVAAG
jgi:hypothetical protein